VKLQSVAAGDAGLAGVRLEWCRRDLPCEKQDASQGAEVVDSFYQIALADAWEDVDNYSLAVASSRPPKKGTRCQTPGLERCHVVALPSYWA
jgi:hypothetical protein